MKPKQLYAYFTRGISLIFMTNAVVFIWRREFNIVYAYCAVMLTMATTCWLTESSRWKE